MSAPDLEEQDAISQNIPGGNKILQHFGNFSRYFHHNVCICPMTVRRLIQKSPYSYELLKNLLNFRGTFPDKCLENQFQNDFCVKGTPRVKAMQKLVKLVALEECCKRRSISSVELQTSASSKTGLPEMRYTNNL